MEIWRVQSFNLDGTVFSTKAFDNRGDAETAYGAVSVGSYKRLAVRTIGSRRFNLVSEAKVSAGGPKAAKVA